VYQHATFEFALSGISRQLVWSFLHSFPFYNTEQQSQRYVKLEEVHAHLPPALRGEARETFVEAVEGAWGAYAELSKRLEPVALGLLSELWRLTRRRSKAFGRSVAREAEKRAIETARYVIPVACHTAMVYTVSGITLHRLRRTAAACDVSREARTLVDRMVAEVERIDPAFFHEIGDAPLESTEVVEFSMSQAGLGDPAALETFDKSLDGRRTRLVDYGVRGPEVVAEAVRQVIGRPDLDDDSALDCVLNPARNRYRLDALNISAHSPLMRTLHHANYTFKKKLSHSADSSRCALKNRGACCIYSTSGACGPVSTRSARSSRPASTRSDRSGRCTLN
jgi:thymidylate synthase ThyX